MKNFSSITENLYITTKKYVDDNKVTSVDGLSGGTLTSPLKISGGNQSTASKISLDQSANGQITDSSTSTLFGFMSSTTLTVGGNSYALALRGSGTRPTYKGADLALYSDIATVPTDYVKYTAQTLTDAQKSQARSNIGAGTSNFSGNYNDLSNKPTIPAAANNGKLTIQKNGTDVATFGANQKDSITANITVPTKASDVNALSLDGGTINKSKTIKMDASANSDGANLKWGTVNSRNPYIGYASDQVDGTFVVGSLLGTNYASGLAIGGGSGNLLWKGAKVATTNDIPNIVQSTGTSTSSVMSQNATTNAISGKLDKTTYEVNKTIEFGRDGALYVGKFKVYDTNVTCEVTSTTDVTYSGKLVIATQNYVIKQMTVYGDAANTVAPNFFIKPSTTSDPYIEVYFKPSSWSKNVVHIYGSNIEAEPTNVCTNVPSVPSTATSKPTNALNSKANLDGANEFTDGTNTFRDIDGTTQISGSQVILKAIGVMGSASLSVQTDNNNEVFGVESDSESGVIHLNKTISLNGDMGTAGQVLTSQGASAAPQWKSMPTYSLSGTTLTITLP